MQRRGTGQRKLRNALVFVVGDERNLGTCRELARKYLAWKSIVDDTEMADGLTRAQFDDACLRMRQLAEALAQRIRSTWSHVLYPVPAQDAVSGSGLTVGFTLEHTSVVNRVPVKPIPHVVYEKLRTNGVIIDELRPDTLMAELHKVWPENKPHIEVATLLDWFASYVYLPRLRDDASLTQAIEKLIGRLDGPVAFAQSYDQQTGRYEGVSHWAANLGTDVAGGLLVWRSALPEQEPAAATGTTGIGFGSGATKPGDGKQPEPGDTKARKPRRFYGSISLDPNKAGLQVAKIAEEILFELGALTASTCVSPWRSKRQPRTATQTT